MYLFVHCCAEIRGGLVLFLYIDPGTGSMLFAILIGLIGALSYLLKNWIVKLQFILSGGKKVRANTDKIPLVIFSDSKRYWNVFDPVCAELSLRGIKFKYMTASPDDPALENPYPNMEAVFIGEGNRAFAKLNFLNADIVLSSTPGLGVYQWKRSPSVSKYVHILHGANEVAGYRMFGLDFYDAVFLSGDYQLRDLRFLEEKRGIKMKDAPIIGIPYMDELAKRKQALDLDLAAENPEKKTKTVLLAPSWGESAILSRYGDKILDELIKTGYNIIIRPHPQSFVSEKAIMDRLLLKYPESDRLKWNRDNDNFNALSMADIMISDFSGVIFDYSLVFNKPVIYADTEFDNSPYDAWWLETPYWTFTALDRIGEKLTFDSLGDIKSLIDSCIEDPLYAEGINAVRSETWAHMGEGAKRAADYLANELHKLSLKEGK